MSLTSSLIAKINVLLDRFSIHHDRAVALDGLKECTRTVRHITRKLKNSTKISEKQHLTTALSTVKSLRHQFKMIRIQGSGHAVKKSETAKHRVSWQDSASAFNSRIRTGVITNLCHKDVTEFLIDCEALFRRRIQNTLKKEEALKVNMTFCGEFVRKKGDDEIRELKYLNTPNAQIYRDTKLKDWFTAHVQDKLLANLCEFQERDSGWALESILNLQVGINKFTPQLGSSYIELPESIKKKKACINVKNDDNECFTWSVVSAMFPAKHSDRMSSYPHPSKVFNLKGIQFPMTIKQIPRFEKQNNISINVYILKKINKNFITLPTYLTKDKNEKHVNLLLIQDNYFNDDDVDHNDSISTIHYHYVWIKDLSRLVSSQLSKYNGKKYFCDRCFNYFYTELGLKKHNEDCMRMNECKIRLPTDENKMLQFKNYKNKEIAPFIIYSDLECILKPVVHDQNYQEHAPCSIGYYVKCSYDDSLSFYRSYRGADCAQWFARELMQFAADLETVFLCPYDIDPLTPEQQVNFDRATQCHICKKPFIEGDKKVRDHFHLTPKKNYRGASHESCNINFKDSHTVPIVYHNLSRYDAHFIIKNIASDMEGRVDLLPITKENYISFTKNLNDSLIKFRFIDSLRFMNSALSTLASYLDEFPILKSEFYDLNDDQFDLLKKKGVYPYDFVDSFDKFDHNVLPSRDAFYNKLEDKNISREQYAHAHEVWNKFECQNLGEYSDLYLKTDVMLLAEIFEQFRRSCHNTYELDPAHYYTLPGFTWDCMLKHTSINLELLTDIDQIMFIERGIRGGLSGVSKRKSNANNKYMPNFDPSSPESYLMYFDVNNQCGWAMSQYLPTGDFKWIEDVGNFDVTSVSDNSDVGYIMEVDLHYPRELHDRHRDLPFCPEHLCAPGSKERKLLATVYDKKKYVMHYRNLKQALLNGLVITKIHRIISFSQSPWLKSYIELNTYLRQHARNEFEKNLFKLMNNAVFGKTMENIRKHSNVKLVNKWAGRYAAEALISKPEFKSSTIFEENLVAIELNKTEIYFNKPIYVGMCILDIAKTTIYDFHYGYMIKEFGDNCSVLYTDTDSLIYEIRNKDVYEVIQRDCHHHFDTSDYSLDNIYGIPRVNKKVLGKLKDESSGTVITDFVGLRSKQYTVKLLKSEADEKSERKRLEDQGLCSNEIAMTLSNIGTTKKAKGVKRSVVKTRITYEDYVTCLENSVEKMVEQNLIKSKKHIVHSITQKKIALSPYDDKRYLIKDSFDTLPWGHYAIMEI